MGATALTALVLAVAGCSSTAGTRSSAGAPPSPSSAAPTTPAAPPATASALPPAPATTTPATPDQGARTTGSYLKTLLPRSANSAMLGLGPALPPGWTAGAEAERDSGPAATAAAPSVVSADSCTYLTGKDLDLAGGLSIATATEPLNSGTNPVGLAFYAYGPGDAAKSLDQVRQNTTTKCAWFSALYPEGAATVDVSATPVSGLGDEALLIKTAPPARHVSKENLLVRRGDVVLSLYADDTVTVPDLTQAAVALTRGMG
ncbi:hypothetical protein ACFW1A_27140 [Kitasatospora sp. NPDC058965]|uniref:hypothetical protein n=1 Tax=Kitasatospora sp. NPDC058965 TaxID=3346682 RepID=UPI003687A7C9